MGRAPRRSRLSCRGREHYYSVPHKLLREKVWARLTERTLEVFHRGKRVAAHVRSSSNRRHTTVREPDVVRTLGLTQVTYYRWRREFGGP